MIFATAGHVDHGKTSLVKALTGVDTDRLDEEKARGLTIDLGFAYLHKEQQSIGFVDVPGHSKFISNMLAGVAAIDHAILVIAADDGPMPQTQEHLAILELLGIQSATVVITKVDRVNSEQLTNSREAIAGLLIATPFINSPMFEVSSIKGDGIDALQQHLWMLKSERVLSNQHHFRLAIDRKFNLKGSGLVVTGSVFSGAVSVNDELRLVPSNTKVRVRAIHSHDRESDHAHAGDRCAINLTGDIDIERVSRGQWLTSQPNLPVSNRFDANLHLLSTEIIPLKTGLPVHIHLGAQHTTGRVFLLEQRELKPGQSALCQVVCESPISSCFADRFVLRDQSANRTLAGGSIIDPFSVQRGRSKLPRLALLKQLVNRDPIANLDQLVQSADAGIDLSQWQKSLNQISLIRDYAIDESGLSHHPEKLKQFQNAALYLLEKSSISQKELRKALGQKESLFKLCLANLIKSQKVELDGVQVSLAGRGSGLSKPAKALWQKVEPILEREALQPPVIHELAKQINLPAAAVEKLMLECIKHGLVVRPVKNRFFLPKTLQQLRALAIEVATTEGGEFTVIQFRDKSSMGRNLCIELLEFLDSKGFTKRLGDKRIIQDPNR